MASFLLFSTEAEAIAAEAKASDNVRQAIAATAPERLHPDGSIYGINAETWQIHPAAQRTERWAIPGAAAGGWVMQLPEADEIAPISLATFQDGIGGQLVSLPLPLATFDPDSPAPTLDPLAP